MYVALNAELLIHAQRVSAQFEILNGPQAVFACPSYSVTQRMVELRDRIGDPD